MYTSRNNISRRDGPVPRVNDRSVIARLARQSRGGVIDLPAAATALNLKPRETSIRLSRLLRKGWLKRAKRGLYFVLPLEAELGKPTVPEDPWVVAESAFTPCYIGGWSAAEYWGLTEQIFRATLVVTAAPVRSKTEQLLGQDFRLFKLPAKRIDVQTTVWRGSFRIKVSSRERTIIDGLRNPEICGGIRFLSSMIKEYMSSPNPNPLELQREAEAAKSGAVWKRLGFLADQLKFDKNIIDLASKHITKGNVKLDPTVNIKGKLVRKWGMWINVDLKNDD